LGILVNKTGSEDDTLEAGSIEQGQSAGIAVISDASFKTLTVSQTVQNKLGDNKLIMKWKSLARYIFSLLSSI